MRLEAFAKESAQRVYGDSPPLLHLHYGSRTADMDSGGFRVCERGICFKSQWSFPIGRELHITLELKNMNDPHALGRTLEIDGVVVESSMILESCGCYLVSLLFVDLPIEDQIKLDIVSRAMTAHLPF